jgi:2-isopropylmalate synthase
VTVALNLYTQGIHPGLDFSDINHIREVYERCTRLEVPVRQPYAGELTFTAFSGSHQDAIKKSWEKQVPGAPWDVLYIPIDPADIGRSYKAIIRINSQSGKGGVAYVLEHEFGFQLPKLMHKEIGRIINDLADATGRELTAAEIHDAFLREYIDRASPVSLGEFHTTERAHQVTCQADLLIEGKPGPATALLPLSCTRWLAPACPRSRWSVMWSIPSAAAPRPARSAISRSKPPAVTRSSAPASTPTSSWPRSRPSSARSIAP